VYWRCRKCVSLSVLRTLGVDQIDAIFFRWLVWCHVPEVESTHKRDHYTCQSSVMLFVEGSGALRICGVGFDSFVIAG
jgi:hypothetical protein